MLEKAIDELCWNLPKETDPIINDNDDEDSDEESDEEDDDNRKESCPQPLTGSLALSTFPIPMLAAAFHAKKLRLFPESDQWNMLTSPGACQHG